MRDADLMAQSDYCDARVALTGSQCYRLGCVDDGVTRYSKKGVVATKVSRLGVPIASIILFSLDSYNLDTLDQVRFLRCKKWK
jgi:hypothetical protein